MDIITQSLLNIVRLDDSFVQIIFLSLYVSIIATIFSTILSIILSSYIATNNFTHLPLSREDAIEVSSTGAYLWGRPLDK